MRRHTVVVLCVAFVVLSLASCRKEGGDGKKRPEPRGPIGQLLEIRRMLADPSYQYRGVPPHERVGWKAEDFFTDPKVIALCKAIEAKDLAKIDELVAQGADVNARGRANMTPLFWAFPMGEEVFRRLLEQGADPNVQLSGELPGTRETKDLAGRYPICLATHPYGVSTVFPEVTTDDPDVPLRYLKLLLEHGADPNIERTDGWKQILCREGESLRLLIAAGADVNYVDPTFGQTALLYQIGLRYSGPLKNTLALLEAGADFRIVDAEGEDFVLKNVFHLVDREKSDHHDQQTEALRKAVREFLTDHGCDLEAAWKARTVEQRVLEEAFPKAKPLDDYEKRSKLWSRINRATAARLRAKIRAEQEKSGDERTPVHLRPWLRPKGRPHERVRWKAEDFFTDPKVIELCKAIEAEDLVEIDELVQSGVDVNARGRANMTPLLWAFPMGEKAFRRLLEHGADPNVKLTERIYPFYAGDSVTFLAAGPSPSHACIFHDVSMDNYLKLVLEHGGDANLQNGHGRTPLFAAVTAFEDSERRIRLLLEAGADIDHQDLYGDTPAMFAERHRRYDSLLVLLEANANLRLVNKSGIDVVFMVGRRLNWSTGRAENETPVVNWLKQRGYDLEAARQACESYLPLRGVPIDQRPWMNRDLAGDSPAGKE